MSYYRPDNLQQALELAAGGNTRIMAGCTDILPATQMEQPAGDFIDISGIEPLKQIERVDGYYRIGAASSWSQIAGTDLPCAFDGLKAAASQIGSIQIQNAATIGGNLCNASPAADGVPALLTLDAKVEINSISSTRTLPLNQFITGPGTTALKAGEILTRIMIPETAARGIAAFSKFGARKYMVISIAMTAARAVISDGRIEEISIAVGACGPVATRLDRLEAVLAGKNTSADFDQIITSELVTDSLSPIDDVRASAEYRNQLALIQVRRLIRELAQ